MMNTTAFRPPQSVDEVIYRIQAAPVGRCSFKLPVSPRFCYEALRAAFEKAVNASYINCIYDEEQCMVLNTIAYWLVGQSYKCGLWLSGFGGTGKTTIVSAIQRLINSLYLPDPIKASSGHMVTAGLTVMSASDLCHSSVCGDVRRLRKGTTRSDTNADRSEQLPEILLVDRRSRCLWAL